MGGWVGGGWVGVVGGGRGGVGGIDKGARDSQASHIGLIVQPERVVAVLGGREAVPPLQTLKCDWVLNNQEMASS